MMRIRQNKNEYLLTGRQEIMEFKEIENKVLKTAEDYCEKYNIKLDEDFAVLKLYEEVGELAQSILIHRKKCRPEKYLSEEESKKELGKELADVLGLLIMVSHLLDVDLEDALNKKWIERTNK